MSTEHFKWFTKELPARFWTEKLRVAHWRDNGEVVGTMALILGKKHVEYFYGSYRSNELKYEGTILFEREATDSDMPEVLKLILESLNRINTVPSPAHVTLARH